MKDLAEIASVSSRGTYQGTLFRNEDPPAQDFYVTPKGIYLADGTQPSLRPATTNEWEAFKLYGQRL